MVSPFCAAHFDYKKPTLNTQKHRHRFMKREKVAIIKLRKLGYSINELSNFIGRSTSVIHRILHTYFSTAQTSMQELRKLPNQVRLASAQKHRLTMDRFIQLWESFIFGDTDEPP
jgi:hypothetical protein